MTVTRVQQRKYRQTPTLVQLTQMSIYTMAQLSHHTPLHLNWLINQKRKTHTILVEIKQCSCER